MSIRLPKQTLLPSIADVTSETPREDIMEPSPATHSSQSGHSRLVPPTNEKENNNPHHDTTAVDLMGDMLEKARLEEASSGENVDETIDHILNDEERPLPKDFGEINVRGHLRFDEEMPPDMETQNNTIHNALMYHITDSKEISKNPPSSSREEHATLTFDTYNPNIDVSHYQTTIIFQHKHFVLHNTSRTFMVPFDEEKPSQDALTWSFHEMVNDNDIVVVIKVVSLPYIMKHGVQAHRKNCDDLFRKVCDLNVHNVNLKIIVEIRIGAVEYALARAIKDFDPSFLVMGTKGLKKAKLTSFLSEDTSLTKHFLDNGRVPVIVVNPGFDPQQYDKISRESAPVSTTFTEKLATYPSVYDPANGSHTLEMERTASGEAPGSSGGRTSRFLRISRSMGSRASSSSSQGGLLSPTTSNDLSPVRSGSRGLSPRRALSPFRLFHRH